MSSERNLEDWIERDPSLLERGLVIVGRQIRTEGGPLDLLAVDPQGRLVLIEIKRERLRREAIVQAIDYASCVSTLDPLRLREQCDGYLKRCGRVETLDGLLDERGRNLETDLDVVIYLVGTGIDAGLERMVEFLTVRADLAIRLVTFSTFVDHLGSPVLAREIHESVIEPRAASSGQSTPSLTIETALEKADRNGVGSVVRTLYQESMSLGLHARPWVKHIMFAPPANRTRCLFVVSNEQMGKEPGFAKLYVAGEAFEQFYGINESDVAVALGSVSQDVAIDQSDAELFVGGLRRLLGPEPTR